MISLIETPVHTPAQTEAAAAARANALGNAHALESTQPTLASVPPCGDSTEFVFGRDGALTARINEQWVSGCSLPRRVAETVLRKMELRGVTGCFLHPTHAQQVRAALDRIGPHQLLIVAIEDESTFHMILHCVDFTTDIRAGRLWFAIGHDWASHLQELLRTHEGLPVPDQFIRTHLSDKTLTQQSIDQIRPLLQQESQRRADQASQLRDHWSGNNGRHEKNWCVLSGSIFRLWQGAARRLWEQLEIAHGGFVRYDPDQPVAASSLALVKAAAQCRGMIAADVGRADLPDLLPTDMPWVTWVTRGRIPSSDKAGPNDRLLLADPQWLTSCRRAGWDEQRLSVAVWPERAIGDHHIPDGRSALIVNTCRIDPEPKMEHSSHRLLWEKIAHEISVNPFVVINSGGELTYLTNRREAMGIGALDFDANRFVNHLIRPAYHQSLAKRLIDRSWPLDLWGRGWKEISEFQNHVRGEVHDDPAFMSAIEKANLLIHPDIDTSFQHEMDSLNRPVLRPTAQNIRSYRAHPGISTGHNHQSHPILNRDSLPTLIA